MNDGDPIRPSLILAQILPLVICVGGPALFALFLGFTTGAIR